MTAPTEGARRECLSCEKLDECAVTCAEMAAARVPCALYAPADPAVVEDREQTAEVLGRESLHPMWR